MCERMQRRLARRAAEGQRGWIQIGLRNGS